MNTTPASERLHIVLAGRCNSGKSSLLNAIAGQDVAIVSDRAGTTTDPVRKAIEITGVGACTIVDTPGLDDTDTIGSLRVGRTRQQMEKADIIVALLDASAPEWSKSFVAELRALGKPLVMLLPKADTIADYASQAQLLSNEVDGEVTAVSALTRFGLNDLFAAIVKSAGREEATITGSLCKAGDTVVLVMPQDPQAPRGRLIMPQVQTIRELLDKECIAVCTTPSLLSASLAGLTQPPALVITDSQVFSLVSEIVPESVPLTSFSVLMAGYKGDLRLFVKGAEALDKLGPGSRVLIAEACSHTPQAEDIGRVKIPRLLRKRAGEELRIDFASGADFSEDLSVYDLVIHCGGCMFTRSHVMARVNRLRQAGVPMTNYGILLAKAAGILPRIVLPD